MNLAKIFAKHASSEAFFYVTLDPERALGLEDLLPNYTIICPYTSRLTNRLKEEGVGVVVLEEELGVKEVEKIVQKGTCGILQSEFVRSYINSDVGYRKPHILVLKNSALIEDLCKQERWHLLAPKARVAEQFENKISQYKLLKNVVPYPRTFIVTLEELLKELLKSDFNKLVEIGFQQQQINNDFGKFVLQFNRGHSGNSTFFIGSTSSPQVKSNGSASSPQGKDLGKLYKLYPKREVKVSEYIKGRTYTLNCLVLKNGNIVTGSISEQITGLKEATNNPNTTVGNDFISPRKLKKESVRTIQEIARRVGEALHKKGYKGFFGIDVIISLARNRRGTSTRLPAGRQGTGAENTTKVYFIEVNTHQPASISFEARLHRKVGKMPLLAYFVLDALCGVSETPHKPSIILPILAKQIIYRNKTAKILSRKYIEKKYKNKGLLSRMKFIKPNEEIYRRQFIK